MASIALRIDITSKDMDYLRQSLRDMPKKIPQAMAASINATLTACRKIVVNGVADVADVKNRSRIVKRTQIKKASKDNLSGHIEIVGRALAAINFPNLVTENSGVFYRPGKSRDALQFAHGFRGVGIVGQGDSLRGNKHLWIRVPNTWHYVRNAHHKPNNYRLMEKIRPIYGPRITTIYDRNPSIKREAEEEAQRVLGKRIRSQVDRFLNRKKKDTPIDEGFPTE